MSDTLNQPETITIECDITAEDILRMQQSFYGSSTLRPWLRCLFVALCTFVIWINVHRFLVMRNFHYIDYPALGVAGLYMCLGVFVLGNARLSTALIARRWARVLGWTRFEIAPGYLRVVTPNSDIRSRWTYYRHVRGNKGDGLIMKHFGDGFIIPARAFASLDESSATLVRIQDYFHAQKAMTTPVGDGPDAWPPPPKAPADESDIPTVGPDFKPVFRGVREFTREEMRRADWTKLAIRLIIMALVSIVIGVVSASVGSLGTAAWYIAGVYALFGSGAIVYQHIQTLPTEGATIAFETDYDWARVTTPTRSTAFRVAAMNGPRMSISGLVLRVGGPPIERIPVPVFGSPERAREVVDRLRGAIREAKKAPT